MRVTGTGLWRALKFWAANSYKHLIKMSIVSAVLSGLTLLGVTLTAPHNPVVLFSFLFMIYMLTLELVSRIIVRNPQVLFHELTYDLKNLEESFKQRTDVSKEIKFQLSFKFKEIDLFIQKIIDRPFLYSNFYDPDVEIDSIMHMIHEGIISYNEKWEMMKVDKHKIHIFNEVHGHNTQRYVESIKCALRNESSPFIRRQTLRLGLYKLMKSSINDFIRLVGDNDQLSGNDAAVK